MSNMFLAHIVAEQAKIVVEKAKELVKATKFVVLRSTMAPSRVWSAELRMEWATGAEDRATKAEDRATKAVKGAGEAVVKEVIPAPSLLLSAAAAAEEVAAAALEVAKVAFKVQQTENEVVEALGLIGFRTATWLSMLGTIKIASEASEKAAMAAERLLGKIQGVNHFSSTRLTLAISSNPSSSSTAPNEQAGGTISYRDEKEYLDSFPPGYKFNPTDEELILHYLQKKINNEKLPPNRIKDVQLYNFDTPEDLITGGGHLLSERENKLYFFTPSDKKAGPKGERWNRETPGGSWTPTSGAEPIYNKRSLIGCKTTLCFLKGKSNRSEKIKTNWIMHEYAVENSGDTTCDGGLKRDNWILCSIYKRQEPKKKRSRESNDERQE